MLQTKMLKQSTLDVIVYRDEFQELQISYNSPADLYKQRYYRVIPREKLKPNSPLLEPSDLTFQYHNVVRSWDFPDPCKEKTCPNIKLDEGEEGSQTS